MTLTCDNALAILDEHLDRQLNDADEVRLHRHLASCERCCGELGRRQQLREALREWPTPEPDQQALELLLENTRQAMPGQPHSDQQSPLRTMLMAASVLLVVAAGGFWFQMFTPSTGDSRLIHVLLDTDTTEFVRVAVDSRQEMEGVTLTVKLPPNVRISGYPDDETFSWETALGAGSNLLTLPLHASAPGEGELLMTVQPPSGQPRTLRVRVQANNKVI